MVSCRSVDNMATAFLESGPPAGWRRVRLFLGIPTARLRTISSY